MDKLNQLLTPGSPSAIDKGCLCPVIVNNHGKGAFVNTEGEAVFWYNKDCPLHGQADDINPEAVLFEIK